MRINMYLTAILQKLQEIDFYINQSIASIRYSNLKNEPLLRYINLMDWTYFESIDDNGKYFENYTNNVWMIQWMHTGKEKAIQEEALE